MKAKPVLIVDDEQNIRLTLSQSLTALGLETDTAVNGEEALRKVEGRDFGLVLLDLRMPGLGGMEVLRRIRERRPDAHIAIITAYGTIDLAVEAMKLGAADFIQKPFSPQEIRDVVSQVLARDTFEPGAARDYASHMALAKKRIEEKKFEAAIGHVRDALAADAGRPEAHNLLGALMEISQEFDEARKHYRGALAVDPGYGPARANLHRLTGWHAGDGIVLEQPPREPSGPDKPGGPG
jgi:FixJ family two-component response regulator